MIARAVSRSSSSSIAGSCSVRHSATLRAPTPGGSSDCTRFSAICISIGSTAGVMPLVAASSSRAARR